MHEREAGVKSGLYHRRPHWELESYVVQPELTGGIHVGQLSLIHPGNGPAVVCDSAATSMPTSAKTVSSAVLIR